MKETMEQNQINTQSKQTTVLFEARLEQLGYNCLSVSCDQFTTLKLMPKEIKCKDEIAPPSE
jgi:hypothetical protein